MSEEQKPDHQARIERMDKIADRLLELAESDSTNATQKASLMSQVMSWYKLRGKLNPTSEDGKLKEMRDAIKPESRRRDRTAKPKPSRDGRSIQKIIDSLPRHDRGVSGGAQDPERPGGSPRSNGSGGHPDGLGDVPRDGDGVGDRGVV